MKEYLVTIKDNKSLFGDEQAVVVKANSASEIQKEYNKRATWDFDMEGVIIKNIALIN